MTLVLQLREEKQDAEDLLQEGFFQCLQSN